MGYSRKHKGCLLPVVETTERRKGKGMKVMGQRHIQIDEMGSLAAARY